MVKSINAEFYIKHFLYAKLMALFYLCIAMVFVYDFHPGSETLMARHFLHDRQQQANGYSNPYNLDGTPRPYSAGKGRTCK